MTKVKTKNNFLYQTSNLNLFKIFQNCNLNYKILEKYEFLHHFITRV